MLTTYDSPVAVVMLHINTKTNLNPNSNPTLNLNYAIINKRTRCDALFRYTLDRVRIGLWLRLGIGFTVSIGGLGQGFRV